MTFNQWLALHRANDTAGDFISCVSGRLSMEIIRIPMNHNGASQNIPNGKPICQHSQIRSAAAAKQWRQVAGMAGMELMVGIEVSACSGESLSRTHSPLVNM